MNRKSANAYDSDDSASDWDTTVAESPTRPNPPPSFENVKEEDELDGDYATVTPRPRLNLKGSDPSNASISPRAAPKTTPRKDIPKRKEEVFSPPPHLNSFKNALSDYTDVYEPAPNVPPKMYGDKGQVYSIPDTDRSGPQVTVNWNDSDEDEKVLQELRQNREKEKDRQKQDAKGESGREQQLSVKNLSAAENHGYEPSPNTSKSVLEQWAKENHDASAKAHSQNDAESRGRKENSKSDRHKKMKTRKPALLPVTMQDSHGKKCVFYFEETSHNSLEAVDEDTDAFLPNNVEEIEKVFRRIWREMFSAVRIVTSFVVLFITEFMSLVIHHILRPLVLDTLTTLGNYFFKPFMTIVFNMIVHPFFALLWNTFNALLKAMGPLVELLGAIFSKIAILLQSFQLFHISYHSHPNSKWKPPEVV